MSDFENNSIIEIIKTAMAVASATVVDAAEEYEDIAELKQHVSHVIDMLFATHSVKITVLSSLEVYDDLKKHGLRLTHKYLVVVEDPLKTIDICKFSKFIHKDITTLGDHFCIWEEGEEIFKGQLTSVSNKPIDSSRQRIERKISTILPAWLDSYLFSNMRAKYAPEHERYEYNLDLNEDEVQIYLGT